MRKRGLWIVLALLCSVVMRGEVVVLRTGETVRGSIVFENEEVVVVKDSSGARYQYPRVEVVSIRAEKGAEEASVLEMARVEVASQAKKVSLLLEVGGGFATMPKSSEGGGMDVDLSIGSHHIRGKRIFLGGGLGYQRWWLGKAGYDFLPIRFIAQIPLLEGEHAPMIGMSLGYGVALHKAYKGGVFAGLNIGYFYAFNARSALFVGADIRLLQGTFTTMEYIPDEHNATHGFSHTAGHSLIQAGVRVGLFF